MASMRDLNLGKAANELRGIIDCITRIQLPKNIQDNPNQIITIALDKEECRAINAACYVLLNLAEHDASMFEVDIGLLSDCLTCRKNYSVCICEHKTYDKECHLNCSHFEHIKQHHFLRLCEDRQTNQNSQIENEMGEQ